MTKRKRDIFTVIESINNRFEASEHYASPIEDHKGSPSCLGPLNTQATKVTTNGWTAEGLDSGNDAEPWTKDIHVASNYTSDNTDIRTQSEVAVSSATRSKADSQLAGRIGEGTDPEDSPGVCSDGGSPADGHNPVSGDDDINEPPVTGTEVQGEGDLTLTSFWRVLADVGYDVW